MTTIELSSLQFEYVRDVAGHEITIDEAIAFVEGLEDHNRDDRIQVAYDIKENGYLVTKTAYFNTLADAMNFIRIVDPLLVTKPILI